MVLLIYLYYKPVCISSDTYETTLVTKYAQDN